MPEKERISAFDVRQTELNDIADDLRNRRTQGLEKTCFIRSNNHRCRTDFGDRSSVGSGTYCWCCSAPI